MCFSMMSWRDWGVAGSGCFFAAEGVESSVNQPRALAATIRSRMEASFWARASAFSRVVSS